jgi:predicted ABC-type ATPase
MPNLYIIAGCNGAGKTTASFTVLPEMLNCREFVNADEIARGISPFHPEDVSIKAGKIMLNRIEELIIRKQDFGFETTLAAKSYVRTIGKAAQSGFFVSLIYFWLTQPELAIERVKSRVISGGHDIDSDTIVRRYYSGLQNFFKLYISVCDYWLFVNNSSNPYKVIAEGEKGKKVKIHNKVIWDSLKSIYYETL